MRTEEYLSCGDIKKLPMDGTTNNQYYLCYTGEEFIFSPYRLSGVLGRSTDGVNWEYVSKGENGNLLIGGNTVDWYSIRISVCGGTWLGQTAGVTDKYLYSEDGVNWEQKTLSVSEMWSDVATSDYYIIMVGGRHIMWTVDGGNTWDSTEITETLVAKTTSYAISIAYDSISSTFFILMSEAQGRKNVVPMLYGDPKNGWTYKEFTLENEMKSVITKDYTWLKNETGIEPVAIYTRNSTNYMRVFKINDEVSLEESNSIRVYSPDGSSQTNLSIVSMWPHPYMGAVIYGTCKFTVDGVTTTYGCLADSYQGKVVSMTPRMNSGINVAVGKDKICIGRNEESYMYYANYVNSHDLAIHHLLNFQDINADAREDWVNFITKMKTGDITNAKDISKWYTDEQINSKKLNELFNYIEYVQLMKDDLFKTDRLMTVENTDPSFDVLKGQMYFYLKEYIE